MLKCGLHKCSSSCHQLFDHSKILCKYPLTQKCTKGHNQSWLCHAGPLLACQKCENDRKQAEKRAQKDLDAKKRQAEKIQKHNKEIEKIEDEIQRLTQSMKDARLDSEQAAILAQKQKDLEAVKERANKKQKSPLLSPLGISDNKNHAPKTEVSRKASQPSPSTAKSNPSRHPILREHIKAAVSHNESPSQKEWQRQKDQENANNPAIDKIMEMIGLEDVKSQVLRIKAKVETSIRQGTDLKQERIGLVLLGNPGTGMSPIPLANRITLIFYRQNHGCKTLR